MEKHIMATRPVSVAAAEHAGAWIADGFVDALQSAAGQISDIAGAVRMLCPLGTELGAPLHALMDRMEHLAVALNFALESSGSPADVEQVTELVRGVRHG